MGRCPCEWTPPTPYTPVGRVSRPVQRPQREHQDEHPLTELGLGSSLMVPTSTRPLAKSTGAPHGPGPAPGPSDPMKESYRKGANLIGCCSCSERNAGGGCSCCRNSGGRSTVHHGNFSVGNHGSNKTGGWSVYGTRWGTCRESQQQAVVTSWRETPGCGMQPQSKAKQHRGKGKRTRK